VPVLFSSHQLALVERICDDLVILAKGRTAAVGPAEELRNRGPVRYRIVLADGSEPDRLLEVPGVTSAEPDGQGVLVQADDVAPAELLQRISAVVRINEFGRHRPPLSEIFREAIR